MKLVVVAENYASRFINFSLRLWATSHNERWKKS